MKICWDNLEEIYLNKNGNFCKGNHIYYLKICENCGNEYLGTTNSRNCCMSCAQKGKNNPMYGKKFSKEHKERMSKSRKGRKHTEETKKKIGNAHKGKKVSFETKQKLRDFNKGRKHTEEHKRKISDTFIRKNGEYRKKNIPKYDTYAHQIDWSDECKRNTDDPNILEVKCTYCGRWFVPNRNSVHNRVQYLRGNKCYSENRLYCSNSCKKECPIYHKSYTTLMKEDAIRAGRLNWIELNREVQPELRQMVLKRDKYTCLKCGNTEHLHCHHIKPVIDDPIESADIDNCITYCKECHKEAHNQDGCKYNELRMCI